MTSMVIRWTFPGDQKPRASKNFVKKLLEMLVEAAAAATFRPCLRFNYHSGQNLKLIKIGMGCGASQLTPGATQSSRECNNADYGYEYGFGYWLQMLTGGKIKN